MVKYLQRVPLDVSINWLSALRHRKDLFKNIKDEMLLEVSKATICRHIKKNGSTACSTKKKYLTTNQVLAKRDRKLFCKKSNVKTRHSTIH